MHDHLGEDRVVVDADDAPGRDTGVDADTGAARFLVDEDRARPRKEGPRVLGVTTNLRLLVRIVGADAFEAGELDTAFLSRLPPEAPREPPPAAVAAAAWAGRAESAVAGGMDAPTADPWKETSGWRSR